MAYFKPSSRHPDTLICVKNHAISELQWRTKDLLQLAEQSHALGKITFLTSALPHIKKNGRLAAASKVKKNAELLTSKWQIVTETITLAPEDEQKSNADFSRAGSQGLKDPSFIKVAEIRLPEMSPADSEPQTTASTNPVVPQAEISPHSLSSPVYSPAAVSSAVNTSPAQPRALAKSFDNNSTASSSSLPGLGVSLLVAAAAGGGGGGGSNPSNNNQLDNKQLSTDTNTSLQGLVMAGPLKAGHGLTVNVFDNRGQKLATGVEVDASGHFSVSLTNVTGTFVLIQVVDTDNQTDYVDEASGSPKDLGMNLRAVIKIGAQTTHVLSVTPLTELAAQLMLQDKNNSVTTNLSGLSEPYFNKYSRVVAMNGNITIDDFNITQGDHLDLDELLSGFAADSFIEDCVQLTKSSNDALLKFDLSGDGVFNTSNALSIQLSGIYTRQTVAEVTLRSLMYGLQADTVI